MIGLSDTELELLADLKTFGRRPVLASPERDRLERLALISEEPADRRRKLYRFGITAPGLRALAEAMG